jgi:hypothetical protein
MRQSDMEVASPPLTEPRPSVNRAVACIVNIVARRRTVNLLGNFQI